MIEREDRLWAQAQAILEDMLQWMEDTEACLVGLRERIEKLEARPWDRTV